MKIAVDAEALRQLLQAVTGPPHYIRELQAISGLPYGMGGEKNPINILNDEYGEWIKTVTYKELTEPKDAAKELGKWMSAALSDPLTCQDFRDTIEAWFAAGSPCPTMENAEIMDAYQAMQEELKWARDFTADITPDIYVSDVGQAWGAETNPDMANDKNMVPYVELRKVKAMQAELRWVKDVLAEHLGYDGPLAPACCPLVEVLTKAEAAENEIQQWQAVSLSHETDLNVTKSALETKEKQIKFAREYAQKCDLIMKGYLPKILQLTALLQRARADVQANFQMNCDLERFQPLPAEDQGNVTKAADKYQEFLDEIDAALWVPPTEGEQA